MERIAAAAIVIALCAANVSTSAQAKPDFSGTWTLVPDPAARGNAQYGPPNTGAITGAEVVLVQTATTLKAQCRNSQTALLFIHTHKLDGSETTRVNAGGTEPLPGRSRAVRFKASWDGSKLLITSRWQSQDDVFPTDAPTRVSSGLKWRGIGTSQLITLESPDTVLVVSTERDYDGVPSVTRATYKRKSKQ